MVQSYNPTTAQSYNRTIIQSYNCKIVQSYNRTTVQSYNPTTIQSYNRKIEILYPSVPFTVKSQFKIINYYLKKRECLIYPLSDKGLKDTIVNVNQNLNKCPDT